MSDILAQLWVPELMPVLVIVIVILVALYLLSIVWVIRDARSRGALWYIWGIVALIPIIGLIAYTLMRPPLLQADRDEQELELLLKQRELMKYGECSRCGYPIEADYVMCPNCHQRLKNLCPTCHHALEPSWSVCPYCTTQIFPSKNQGAQRRTRSSMNQDPTVQARPQGYQPQDSTERTTVL